MGPVTAPPMAVRTISQADQSLWQAQPGSTAADPAGGLSQCVTLCGAAHTALSATTASAYHKQRQRDMRHNDTVICPTTASAYGICRNCNMRHNDSVILCMPQLAYAPCRIDQYDDMRPTAYYGSVIPPYAHMPICPYRHMRLESY